MSSERGKYAPVPGKIPGRALNLGGVDFIVAPMNWDNLKIGLPLLEKRAKEAGDTEAALRMAAEFIQLALSRNNPDITVDEVFALIDLGNCEPTIKLIAEASGLQMGAPGEK